MKRSLILLAGMVALYLLSSLVLHLVYGPSFGFLEGEDCWIPDENGGWVAHGTPAGPQPDQPSVIVPIPLRFLPILLPGIALAVMLLTPLSRLLDKQSTPTERDIEETESLD